MNFRTVEMQYRKHADRLCAKRFKAGRQPGISTANEIRGIAYYLYAAEQVWNPQRETVAPSGGFEMRSEIRPFGGFR